MPRILVGHILDLLLARLRFGLHTLRKRTTRNIISPHLEPVKMAYQHARIHIRCRKPKKEDN